MPVRLSVCRVCLSACLPVQVVSDWSAAVLTLVGCAAGDVAVCGPDDSGKVATANDTFGFNAF